MNFGTPMAPGSYDNTGGQQYVPPTPNSGEPGSLVTGTNVINGYPQQSYPTGGNIWRAPYGGDVGTTFNPGQQQGDPSTGYPQQGYPQQGGNPQAGPTEMPNQGQGQGGNNGLPFPESGGQGPVGPGSSGYGGGIEHPSVLKTAFWGGTGAYLAAGPVPKLLNAGADAVLNTGETQLGTSLLGEGSWLAKQFPKAVPTLNNVGERLNGLTAEDGALSKAATWWKSNYQAPAETVKAAAPSTAEGLTQATVSAGNDVGFGDAAAMMNNASKTGQAFLAKPGVQTFLKGAGIAGGTILADHILPGPKDDYHLSSVGIPLALVAEGPFKTQAMIAGGTLLGGKLLNAVLPADSHPEIAHIMQPTALDTVLTTGAIFLPTASNEAKLGLIGGSWVLGRMRGMNTLESGAAGAGLGALTYKFTHNVALSVGVGAGSWLFSRLTSR